MLMQAIKIDPLASDWVYWFYCITYSIIRSSSWMSLSKTFNAYQTQKLSSVGGVVTSRTSVAQYLIYLIQYSCRIVSFSIYIFYHYLLGQLERECLPLQIGQRFIYLSSLDVDLSLTNSGRTISSHGNIMCPE